MKAKKFNLKKGDPIVYHGHVYKIVKKGKVVNQDSGEKEDSITFRHYFVTPENHSIVHTLPVSTIDFSVLRRPLSKRKMNEMLKGLGSRAQIDPEIAKTKEAWLLSDPDDAAEKLRHLWKQKQDESKPFSSTKHTLMRKLLSRISEEVALVLDLEVNEAYDKIERSLMGRDK